MLLLFLQTALIVWGAAKNSVTFDENFHLPDGVLIAAKGDFRASPFNPPLVKAMCGGAALAAGARLPDPDSVKTANEFIIGESFMRRNADRYHRVYFAARLVVVAIALALGFLVWSFSRRLYGPRGALLTLGLFSLSAETLAHGGVAGTDLPTAFGIFATVYAIYGFARSGRWSWWAMAVLALGFALLTRFTSLILFPMLALLAGLAHATGGLRRPRRLWIGLALLVLTAPLLINLGYLFQTPLRPLRDWTFYSSGLKLAQRWFPWLYPLLPEAYLQGFDWQSYVARQVDQPVYLLGQITNSPIWYYFPLALLFKWPLGFLGAFALRLARSIRERIRPRLESFTVIPAAILLLGPMFLLPLDIGIRYVYPMLPFLCVWLGGLWPRAIRQPAGAKPRSAGWLGPAAGRVWRVAAVSLALVSAIEVGRCAPWYLSFFNLPSGGPGGGFMLLNDSNVDWGQGLIALRDEMRKRGIQRIHLAYHGTADPAVYGIDYIPYHGGDPGPGSDWFAISDFYLVGLEQRMMTQKGRTGFIHFGIAAFPFDQVVARPGGCMQLIPLPR